MNSLVIAGWTKGHEIEIFTFLQRASNIPMGPVLRYSSDCLGEDFRLVEVIANRPGLHVDRISAQEIQKSLMIVVKRRTYFIDAHLSLCGFCRLS